MVRRRVFIATAQGLAIVYKEEEDMRSVVVGLTAERVGELLRTGIGALASDEGSMTGAVEAMLDIAEEFAREDLDEDADSFEDDDFDSDGEVPL